MSRGFHLGDIHFLELLNVAQDVVQLAAQAFFLIGSECQTGQIGDILDLEVGHG